MSLSASLSLALPELLLALGAMAMLMVGVFTGDRSLKLLTWSSVGLFIVAIALVVSGPAARTVGFNGLFVVDAYGSFLKVLVLIGAAASVVLAVPYLERNGIAKFEYPVLIALATVGMLMMLSANDLLSLYLGLELQSLSLYVMAAYQRNNARSSESGLKYFVLGSLASGLLLYGVSLVYGFAGTTNFEALAITLEGTAAGSLHIGLLIGLVFVIAGLAFKVSAVPFHMWTPDVYEGAPTPVTAFFAAAPKIAALGLFVRVMLEAFPALTDQWQQIIVVISIGSMILGAIAAIVQTNVKRLMAYSSIGHVGYALIGLAAGTQEGVQGVLVYMAIYLLMTVGAFLCVLSMQRGDEQVEDIYELAGLSQTQPRLAACFAILMFSLAGIPLLAGFFGKLYIFQAAIDAELYTLAIFGILTSVVAAYYYLRVVKIIYFDEPKAPFTRYGNVATASILGASAILCSPVSFLYIAPLLQAAGNAAKSLIG
ncbi:NADH-quinone oxidoreductase subunit NuoN [Pedomonas mirosovicensis]|uniref:NADH-quinone oxidoreductase subunit NuoN n=1 Tax=Pedomonas mirosovicensis TaxID=2908641 RepID=UPI00216A295C|nr:NADH-quinone oxidoreductase subunit NuoN [Pedomonas mirosovicensis]MCH8685344.1 NADH-quinone oxidoreductase subunit NuoN [Pedomonas mirosovicensis]